MTAEPEVSRRERKKEKTKERIFKAAFALFKHQGVEATTVDEICEKADVAKGTFFNYFPHKEAVFGYLGEDWFAQAEEESAAILARPGGPAADPDVLGARCVLRAGARTRQVRLAGVDAQSAHRCRRDV